MRSVSVHRRCGLVVLPVMSVLLGAPAEHARAQTPQFRAFWADAFHHGYRDAGEVDTMISYAVTGGYNAILLEVMAYGDDDGSDSHGAFWNSAIVPANKAVTAEFDPLRYTCQKAHEQGIEVHAWLFPFRVSQLWPGTNSPSIPSNGQWLMVPAANRGGGPFMFDGNAFWLDAGSPDVQEYLVSVVKELVANYPIDGIHWDYELSGSAQLNNWFPADVGYANSGLARYMRLYNTLTVPAADNPNWADYRRRAMNELMRRCQAEIEATEVSADNPRRPLRHTASLMAYGAAPATCDDFATTSSYKAYADFATWMQNGWLDAGVPMNYKNPNCNGTQFNDWVDRLLTCWRYNRHMYIGQGNYYNSFSDSKDEMKYALDQGADGVVNFSYWSTVGNQCTKTTGNDFAWYPYIAANLFTEPAALPAMPWRNTATATEGMLFGRVTDATTGLPIDDATVQVGTQPSVQTDGNGYYVVTLIPADESGVSYAVTAGAARHAPTTHDAVQVVAGTVRRDDIVLEHSGCWPPTVTEHPQTQSVLTGGTATFTVAATGEGTPGHQWFKNGVPLADGGHYAGVTTPTLTVSTVDSSDVASYRCGVTDACDVTYSNEAMLTLRLTPGADFIVESRSGGKNYANYAEVGDWADSGAKSTASGTTVGIGSRWATQDFTAVGLKKAIYSFTPPQRGIYEVYVTWPSSSNASPYVEHVVTHVNGATSLLMNQNGSSLANKWNSLGQFTLNADTLYTVTQTNENYWVSGYIIRTDAVKWKYVGRDPSVRVYSFPMDTDPGWTTQGLWAFGQPTGGAAEYGFPDPTSGHTGTNVYGYNLNGGYELSLPATYLTTTPMNCTGMKCVTLKFWRWLVVYDPYYDHASVQVSKDGANWVTVWQNTSLILDTTWMPQRFNISAVADNQPTVYVRWTMGPTGNLYQLAGWNIDDVELWGTVGDSDNDGDVDLNDFASFQGCFNGPNRPYAQPACAGADLDHDNDVDLMDFSLFQSCFNGPNRPPACD